MTQALSKMAFWVAIRLTRWLKSHGEAQYKKLTFELVKNEASPLGRQERSVYKANNQTSLESLVQQGSSGDAQRHKPELISLPAWTSEIQPFLHNQLSDHTRRAYETDLKHFFQFLQGRLSPGNFLTLKAEHIILYRKFLEEGRLTGKTFEKSTVNRKLAVVKSFLTWLKANHVITQNPAEHVKGYPQSQESSLVGFSDEEARRMLLLPNLNSRAGAMHSAVLHCLLYLGLRKSELLGLKRGDMTEERGVKVIKVRGKGHRVRILPITGIVHASLEHYFRVCRIDGADTEAPLFVPTKNPKDGNLQKVMNPHAITYMVVKYARKAGVLKKVSPHSCRATCISNALDKRATHRSVQYLAGWSTPLMIQRYDKRREDLKNSAAFVVDYGEAESTASGAGAV